MDFSRIKIMDRAMLEDNNKQKCILRLCLEGKYIMQT